MHQHQRRPHWSLHARNPGAKLAVCLAIGIVPFFQVLFLGRVALHLPAVPPPLPLWTKPKARLLSRASASRWLGVNYGNRFIPEDWMQLSNSRSFFAGVRKHERVDRVSLWDLSSEQEPPPRQRMLTWLEAAIAEEHFAEMKRWGVEVVRVPCGYWNWVSYEEGAGPAAPRHSQDVPVAEKLKNLHRIAKPEEYAPYFDRIFAFARKYGIKVLLDLHGLPGSQNGEIHSGACLEVDNQRGTPFFERDSNKVMAVKAVRAMARYAKGQRASLFGIQVISEPHLPSPDRGHSFLRDYYEKAILAVRESLEPAVPVVLFEWTYGMEDWAGDEFPEEDFGRVMWDTHLYHFPQEGEEWTSPGGLEQVRRAYDWDLQQLRSFAQRQQGGVLVGEFALAGPSLNRPDCLELAQWLLHEFSFAAAGCLVWSFDGIHPAWSMRQQVRSWGICWRQLLREVRVAQARRGAPVLLQASSRAAAEGGTGASCTWWLSAREDGSVCLSTTEPSQNEEWVPYSCGEPHSQLLALRSAAQGGWLSVDEAGRVSQCVWQNSWEEFRCISLEAEEGGTGLVSSPHGSCLCALVDLGAVLAVPQHEGMPESLGACAVQLVLKP